MVFPYRPSSDKGVPPWRAGNLHMGLPDLNLGRLPFHVDFFSKLDSSNLHGNKLGLHPFLDKQYLLNPQCWWWIPNMNNWTSLQPSQLIHNAATTWVQLLIGLLLRSVNPIFFDGQIGISDDQSQYSYPSLFPVLVFQSQNNEQSWTIHRYPWCIG